MCGFWGPLSLYELQLLPHIGLEASTSPSQMQSYNGIRLLIHVPKLKYLKNLNLRNLLGIIIMHCRANNVGKTRLKRLLGIISDTVST